MSNKNLNQISNSYRAILEGVTKHGDPVHEAPWMNNLKKCMKRYAV